MRLNQVTVSARDLDASIRFYRTLGLTLIVRSEHYARFACADAGGGAPSTFSLHHDAAASGVSQTVVYFEDDALDATVARLVAEGITFDTRPVDQPWRWREAYLRDPTGNVVCLYQAGAMRLDPPWRLREGE